MQILKMIMREIFPGQLIKQLKHIKKNPLLNAYRIESELEDVLTSGYHKSPLGYDNVDFFLDEVIKLENRMGFYFKNTNKAIIMTDEDEED